MNKKAIILILVGIAVISILMLSQTEKKTRQISDAVCLMTKDIDYANPGYVSYQNTTTGHTINEGDRCIDSNTILEYRCTAVNQPLEYFIYNCLSGDYTGCDENFDACTGSCDYNGICDSTESIATCAHDCLIEPTCAEDGYGTCSSPQLSACVGNILKSNCEHLSDGWCWQSETNCASSGKICVAGECCTNHASSSCNSGDVYWYDSCDNKQDKKEECGTGTCQGNICVESPHDLCTESSCNLLNQYELCSDSNNDGYKEITIQDCINGQTCVSSLGCVGTTPPTNCTFGACASTQQYKCANNILYKTCNDVGNGLWCWSTKTNCSASGKYCIDGSCSSSPCPAGEKLCNDGTCDTTCPESPSNETACLGLIQKQNDLTGKCELNPIVMIMGAFVMMMVAIKLIKGSKKS